MIWEIQDIEGQIVMIYARDLKKVRVHFYDEKSGIDKDCDMVVDNLIDYELCCLAHLKKLPLRFRGRVYSQIELESRISIANQNNENQKSIVDGMKKCIELLSKLSN